MRRASTLVSGRLKPAVAIVLIAALAAGQPAMLVSMARTPVGGAAAAHGAHAAHRAGSPHHHALLLQCCSLCSLACTGAAAVPSAPAGVASPEPARPVAAPAREETCRRAAWPHRLPFSIGPPTLRFA